jgi:hypothetical protein
MRRFVLSLSIIALAGCANDIAKNDHALAEFQKGNCKAAASELLPLAERGVAAAQNNIGGIYEMGCPSAGIQKDYAQAFRWYSLAAKSNYPMGMRNVGLYYQQGLGVERNEAAARDWYTTAARWGNERAKRDLEAMGVPVPPPDLYNEAVRKQQEAEAARAAKQQEILNDTVTVLLGAALGVAASHNQAASPTTYAGPFTGGQQHDASTTTPSTYHGAFTGTPPSNVATVQSPTSTSGVINTRSGTSSFWTIGNTTYVTHRDGTTSAIIEKTADANYGRDPRTGRTWTEIKDGDNWFGKDSNGKSWTKRQIGDSVVTTYSDGKTETCRAVGDQLSCF